MGDHVLRHLEIQEAKGELGLCGNQTLSNWKDERKLPASWEAKKTSPNTIKRAEIESAEDPAAHLKELQDTYRAIQSPFRTAEALGIEDIIDPRDTRSLLCDWAEMAYEIEKNNLGPKRGV